MEKVVEELNADGIKQAPKDTDQARPQQLGLCGERKGADWQVPLMFIRQLMYTHVLMQAYLLGIPKLDLR